MIDSENGFKGNHEPYKTYEYAIYHPATESWYMKSFKTNKHKFISASEVTQFRSQIPEFLSRLNKSDKKPLFIAYNHTGKNFLNLFLHPFYLNLLY